MEREQMEPRHQRNHSEEHWLPEGAEEANEDLHPVETVPENCRQHLSLLLSSAHSLLTLQRSDLSHLADCSDLQRQLLRLRQRRAMLQMQLAQAQRHTLLAQLLPDDGEAQAHTLHASHLHAPERTTVDRPRDRAAEDARVAEEHLAELLAIGYDLGGVCLSEVDAASGSLTVRVRTSHRARYLDSYYVILQRVDSCSTLVESSAPATAPDSAAGAVGAAASDRGGCFVVSKHSIPAFIPLLALQQRHLPEHVQIFLEELHAQLNAFVARREELIHFEHRVRQRLSALRPPLHLGDQWLVSTAACDLVRISLPPSTQLTLRYELTSSRPHRVSAISSTASGHFPAAAHHSDPELDASCSSDGQRLSELEVLLIGASVCDRADEVVDLLYQAAVRAVEEQHTPVALD